MAQIKAILAEQSKSGSASIKPYQTRISFSAQWQGSDPYTQVVTVEDATENSRVDLIIVKSIDRLGRNYDEILQLWQTLTKQQQVDIKVLDMPLLDTTYCKDLLGTFVSDLVLQVLSFQAETERENIKQRQAEGIAAARSKGLNSGVLGLSFPIISTNCTINTCKASPSGDQPRRPQVSPNLHLGSASTNEMSCWAIINKTTPLIFKRYKGKGFYPFPLFLYKEEV